MNSPDAAQKSSQGQSAASVGPDGGAPKDQQPDRGAHGVLARLDRIGRRVEDGLLMVLLLVMLLVAVAQIVARNGFDTGFLWADEFLRLTVLWVALLGSIAASRDHRHLRIDVLSRFMPQKYLRWTNFVVDLFTVFICAVLAYYSFQFVMESREYEDIAFTKLPLWWFQSILPIGFALMSWRFFIWALRRVRGDITTNTAEAR